MKRPVAPTIIGVALMAACAAMAAGQTPPVRVPNGLS